MEDNEPIVLKKPVEHEGHTYNSLEMREPTVQDTLIANKQGGTEAEVEVRLFANLCEVPDAVVRKTTLKDYAKLQRRFESFLA
jgi:hypothetical protein